MSALRIKFNDESSIVTLVGRTKKCWHDTVDLDRIARTSTEDISFLKKYIIYYIKFTCVYIYIL